MNHTQNFDLLKSNKVKLDKLAKALLHEETIDRDGLTKILGAKPSSGFLQKVERVQ
jgi:ATP-dependent Zn protease